MRRLDNLRSSFTEVSIETANSSVFQLLAHCLVLSCAPDLQMHLGSKGHRPLIFGSVSFFLMSLQFMSSRENMGEKW